ncbi:MAG: Osmolarity sensor protein EnvZ [Rhodocyclaceae bacterium]|nr:MAG: HAMP domain-containing protein [Rhodocyclaceae bacterium]MBE7421899.1 HAMP domain-containing protein [Zoogloeaceae bacterium]MBV6407962.1 Osmolarity sensor protein EnvZ [Rhodocyclaceae bacterium]MCK6384344.1 ATP-binding protein [Rhodocyclaceae bacterium]CAG0929024.1 two-component system, OmpR family, osmolarity sensor histidine kinase EnvZ [Rhodocyclaceae bacterium]
MTLLPRGLLWRTFLLVASLMAIAAVAWAAIFAHAEREPRARQMAQLVVSVVNLTRTALLTAQPDKRLELLIELSSLEGIRIYPAEEDDRVEPLPDQFAPVAQMVRDGLGPRTRLTLEHDGEAGFWVSFHVADGDEYWMMLPRERVERGFPLQWLGWGAAVLGLALAGAYLVMFRVARPLKGLSDAARGIGRGERPAPLAESGPAEIRTVTHAFNQMSQDLARLDEDRALILAGISHDLRTPLTRLRLAAEMSGDAGAREGMAADIEDMDKIIGQFLDFARDAQGEPAESTDLNAVVRHVIEPLQKRGAKISLKLGELPVCRLRPLGLLRLTGNLVGNALRYGSDDVVEVATRREADRLLLEVMDRGPGIPSAEAERLKRPFTRLEGARTDAGGAGLGLAIVERIARSHGGALDLLPREGGGLTARVTLPVVQA